MFFSVVIPLYNKERHIKRAVESVLSQKHQDFEIIIVNDGSTDSSLIEARSIADSRISIVNQTNSGVSKARNIGINKASHEYVAFLDADDAWLPNFLEIVNKLILEYPNAGAYCTSYVIRKSSHNIVKSPSSKFFDENWCGIIDDYFKYSMKTPLISASSVVIPRSVLKEVGAFNHQLSRGEDLDLWIRIALKYEIAYSNSTQAIYFLDAENRSFVDSLNINKSIVSIAEEELADKQAKGIASFYYKEYMIRLILTKAKYFIYNGEPAKARKLLWKQKETRINKYYLAQVLFLSFIPHEVAIKIPKLKNRLKVFISKFLINKSKILGDSSEK